MPKTQDCLAAERINMSREDHAMCFFAGDKLLTTPNQDVNEDLKMFEMLGLIPQKPFTKVSPTSSVEAIDSQFIPLGEKPK